MELGPVTLSDSPSTSNHVREIASCNYGRKNAWGKRKRKKEREGGSERERERKEEQMFIIHEHSVNCLELNSAQGEHNPDYGGN